MYPSQPEKHSFLVAYLLHPPLVKRVFDLVMLFGTSESPKSTRPLTAYCAPTVLRTSRFRIAQTQQAAGALLHHDSRK
ncbi:MAG: hypothetical protein ABW170_12010 [Candidatus Thiodiazotropha sp. L084R]